MVIMRWSIGGVPFTLHGRYAISRDLRKRPVLPGAGATGVAGGYMPMAVLYVD